MENLEAAVQKSDGFHVEKLTTDLLKDAKIFPSSLMPKFKPPKVPAIRSFPKVFTQSADSILQENLGDELEIKLGPHRKDVEIDGKLMNGEKQGISCGVQAMKIEPVVIEADTQLGTEMPGYLKDGKQIGLTESVECESNNLIEIVDTFKQNQVDNGGCLDLVYNLRARECDMIKPKRCKVFALRDFPKGLNHFDVKNKKFKQHCLDESGDDPVDHISKDDHVKETNDDSDKHLKVDFGSQGALVDPLVDKISCKGKYEKQEPVVTIDRDGELESDVDLELYEAREDEETIGQFKCGEHDSNSSVIVENVPLVKNASEDAENFQLANRLCTSLVNPCGSLKRRKVSAVRDYPAALEILKKHNEASEKSLDLRAADKMVRNSEATGDCQGDVESFETDTKSLNSSAPSEKGLSYSLRTLLTPNKVDTEKIGAHIGVVSGEEATAQLTGLEHDGTSGDKQDQANCVRNSTVVGTRTSSEVTDVRKGNRDELHKEHYCPGFSGGTKMAHHTNATLPTRHQLHSRQARRRSVKETAE